MNESRKEGRRKERTGHTHQPLRGMYGSVCSDCSGEPVEGQREAKPGPGGGLWRSEQFVVMCMPLEFHLGHSSNCPAAL